MLDDEKLLFYYVHEGDNKESYKINHDEKDYIFKGYYFECLEYANKMLSKEMKK